jgi:Zn-dependent protease with chaperone function
MRNFFEHQAEAQRRTRWLLVGMPLAILGMGSALFGLLWATQFFMRTHMRVSDPPDPRLWREIFAGCVIGTALLVTCASLWRVLSLRGGGARVVEMLGGHLVSGQPRDALERRLLNVVEELAIAAGVPVPLVFVLDGEQGINALAAGWELQDAALAVTRSSLEKLTRAELQGVIGHEFSHILHGDMRLNLRLMGTVFGILCIAMLGQRLMRSADWARKNGSLLAAFGLGVYGVGSLGALFGNLIKAAVSRQREFLADASAVQFTRDPTGISRALQKIGGFAHGAGVHSAGAEEASHFFFGDIHGRDPATSWFATHPSLRERILRLEPDFQGQFPAVADSVADPPETSELVSRIASGSVPTGNSLPPAAAELVAGLGGAGESALAASRAWLQTVPAQLRAAAESPYSACALMYALLLSDEAAQRGAQEQAIETRSSAQLLAETRRLAGPLAQRSRAERLSLAELAAPARRRLSASQNSAFMATVRALTQADGAVTVFEYVLADMLSEHAARPAPQRRQRTLSAAPREIELVLSLVAHAGDFHGNVAATAFARAAERLPGLTIALLPASPRLLSALRPALEELRTLRPSASAQLVDACAHAVLADHRVSDDELTLLRCVCMSLNVPIPWMEPGASA